MSTPIEGPAAVRDAAVRLNQQPSPRMPPEAPGGPASSPSAGSAALIAGLASFGVTSISASGDFFAGEHTISVMRSGGDLVVSVDGGVGVVVTAGSPVVLRGSKGTLTITFGDGTTADAPKAETPVGETGGGTLQELSRRGVRIGPTGAGQPHSDQSAASAWRR